MFTVKASYRQETRRILFDSDNFPTFTELCYELRRKFPTLTAFHLSHILLCISGDPGPSKLLIGIRINNSGDYDDRIAPYQGRSWPGAVLKFNVVDTNPPQIGRRRALPPAPSVSGLSSAATSRPSSMAMYSTSEETPISTPATETFPLFSPDSPSTEEARRCILNRIRERTSTRSLSGAYTPDNDDMTVKDDVGEEENSDVTAQPEPASVYTSHDSSSLIRARLPELRRQLSQLSEVRRQRQLLATPSTVANDQVNSAYTPSYIVNPPMAPLPASNSEELKATDEALRKQSESLEKRSDALLQELRRSNQTWRNQFLANIRAAREIAGPHTISRTSSPDSPSPATPSPACRPSSSVASPAVNTINGEQVASPTREFSLYPSFISQPAQQATFRAPYPEPTSADLSCEGIPAERPNDESLFDAASERTVDLGLELLRSTQRLSNMYGRPLTRSPPAGSVLQSDCRQTDSPVYHGMGTPRNMGPMVEKNDFVSRPLLWSRSPSPVRIEVCSPPEASPQFISQPDPFGWQEECEKLKKQIEDVHRSLSALRTDFDQAVNTATFASKTSLTDSCIEPTIIQDCTMPSAGGSTRVDTSTSLPYTATVMAGNTSPTDVIHPHIICDGCDKVVHGVRHKCLDCDDFDFCTTCLCSPEKRIPHNSKHSFFPITTPNDKSIYQATRFARGGVEHAATCDGCNRRILGTRHKCLDCNDFDLCDTCISTANIRSQHSMEHAFYPIEVPWNKEGFTAALRCHRASTTQAEATVHPAVICDACDKALKGVRHKCLQCDDYDLCSSCISNQAQRSAHDITHAFFPVPTPADLHAYYAARTRLSSTPRHAPTHNYVACDSCRELIVGVRHKCLDCPNFDLCSDCVGMGRLSHPSTHQFFPITQPGDVVVHTVHSDALPLWGRANTSRQPSAEQDEPIVHAANCNLCDSRIRGDRYKCLNCPNVDTCAACFDITREQHPGHGFVKVSKSDQLHLRDTLRDGVVHSAACNECRQPIRGSRFKCMHPDCLDFDLCQNCEALPIPVHPLTHPLLKIKLKETFIPFIPMVASTPNPFAQFKPMNYPSDVFTPAERTDSPQSPYISEPAILEHYLQQYEPLPQVPKPCSTHVSDYELPDVPPLLPASWTPPEIDWRWNNTPPGPMVVPNMLSEEASTRAKAMPTCVQFPPPPASFTERSQTPSSAASPVIRPISEYSEDASPPGLRAPLPLPVSPPRREHLIDLDEPSREGHETDVNYTESGSPITLTQPVPRLGPVANTEWRELWPEMTTVLRHLLQPPSPPAAEPPVTISIAEIPVVHHSEPESQNASITSPEFETAVESPLAQEPLLSRPGGSEMTERTRDFGHNLVEYLNRVIPPLPALPAPPRPMFQATYVLDNNIAEGQIFPPGAEFVKSWRVRNDGSLAWPEETSLRFVAGDRLAPLDAARVVPVGSVPPGDEVDLHGGDMKAPEIAGKYVSYWRLHDGQQYFGTSVWVDIVVAEPDHHSDDNGTDSLAASSVVMPPAPSMGTATRASTGLSLASLHTPSAPLSDDGSFDSSLSLINVPSSPSIDDEDDEIYQDSRSRIANSPAVLEQDLEYVVLYDTSSSGDE